MFVYPDGDRLIATLESITTQFFGQVCVGLPFVGRKDVVIKPDNLLPRNFPAERCLLPVLLRAKIDPIVRIGDFLHAFGYRYRDPGKFLLMGGSASGKAPPGHDRCNNQKS